MPFAVQIRVVGNEHIVGHHLLYHRMPPLLDINQPFCVQFRPHITVLLCHTGQRAEYVQICDDSGGFLDPLHFSCQGFPDGRKGLIFQCTQSVLSPENRVCQLIQFLRCISLGVGKRLFPYIMFRHFVLVGIRHIQIISEHLVEFHLQGFDSGGAPLPLFQLHQPLFAVRLGTL